MAKKKPKLKSLGYKFFVMPIYRPSPPLPDDYYPGLVGGTAVMTGEPIGYQVVGISVTGKLRMLGWIFPTAELAEEDIKKHKSGLRKRGFCTPLWSESSRRSEDRERL